MRSAAKREGLVSTNQVTMSFAPIDELDLISKPASGKHQNSSKKQIHRRSLLFKNSDSEPEDPLNNSGKEDVNDSMESVPRNSFAIKQQSLTILEEHTNSRQ
jgi:hypothetical protein